VLFTSCEMVYTDVLKMLENLVKHKKVKENKYYKIFTLNIRLSSFRFIAENEGRRGDAVSKCFVATTGQIMNCKMTPDTA